MEYDKIELADGRHVRLIQPAYNDNDCAGNPAWFAAGYLSDENEDDETGPTVTVTWASLGAAEPEDDADWLSPASIMHYVRGELEPRGSLPSVNNVLSSLDMSIGTANPADVIAIYSASSDYGVIQSRDMVPLFRSSPERHTTTMLRQALRWAGCTGGDGCPTTTMITTTLNAIREQGPCADGWRTLLAHLGKTAADDEPLPLATILAANGIDDALWCLRALPDEYAPMCRRMAVEFARAVEHLITDERGLAAISVAARHAEGLASDAELAAAGDVAWDVAWDAARAVRAVRAVKVAARVAWAVAIGDAAGAAKATAAFAVAATGAVAQAEQSAVFLRYVHASTPTTTGD